MCEVPHYVGFSTVRYLVSVSVFFFCCCCCFFSCKFVLLNIKKNIYIYTFVCHFPTDSPKSLPIVTILTRHVGKYFYLLQNLQNTLNWCKIMKVYTTNSG